MKKKPPKGLSKWGRRDWYQQQRNLRFARRIRSQERSRNRELLALSVKEFEAMRATPRNDRDVGVEAGDLARVVEYARGSDLSKIFRLLKRFEV